jgi:hypothetical protein
MKHIAIASLFAASLSTGCKKQPAPTCDGIAQGIDAVTASQLKAAPPEAVGHIKDVLLSSAARMKSMMRERCSVDRWSSDAIACVTNATSSKALVDCRAKLTPEQSKAMEVARSNGAVGNPSVSHPTPLPSDSASPVVTGSGSQR